MSDARALTFSFEDGLAELEAIGPRQPFWQVLWPLLDQHPSRWAELADMMNARKLGPQVHQYNLVRNFWRCIAQERSLPDDQWRDGARALLDAISGDRVAYEFAQDLIGYCGNALRAARCLPILTAYCQDDSGEAETQMFWQQAGEEMLGWIMKLDDLDALDELMRHAQPEQGLSQDGLASWAQVWVMKRTSIPYLPNNHHKDMLERLANWGVDLERTHTNITPLELAGQDHHYPDRCSESIQALIGAGADWTVLDKIEVPDSVRMWMEEHPVVRRARLEGLVSQTITRTNKITPKL